jgi:hypothetical protein
VRMSCAVQGARVVEVVSVLLSIESRHCFSYRLQELAAGTR